MKKKSMIKFSAMLSAVLGLSLSGTVLAEEMQSQVQNDQPLENVQPVKLTKQVDFKLKQLPTSIYEYVLTLSNEKGYNLIWNSESLGQINPEVNLKSDLYEKSWGMRITKAVSELNQILGTTLPSAKINVYLCNDKKLVVSNYEKFEKTRKSLNLKHCNLLQIEEEVKYYLPSGKEYKEGMEIQEEDLIKPEDKKEQTVEQTTEKS